MRNRILSCAIFIALGALLAIGPYTIFPVCREGMMAMKCQNTARAELVVGALIAITGVLAALVKEWKIRVGINIVAATLGLLAFLLPNVLMGVCDNKHMTCRSLALPGISVVSIFLTAFAGVNALYLRKTRNREVT